MKMQDNSSVNFLSVYSSWYYYSYGESGLMTVDPDDASANRAKPPPGDRVVTAGIMPSACLVTN